MEEINKIDEIKTNINTKSYWDSRFGSGDWEKKGGRNQTSEFAQSQIPKLDLPSEYSGSILDFGCGLGDAIPIYSRAFPNAKLYGIDVSSEAIENCKKIYGGMAQFIVGTHKDAPCVDMIISSNVFEHLSDEFDVARNLIKKCKNLIIIVPYKETPLCDEHVRSYNHNHYAELGSYRYKIFDSKGWSEYGIDLFKLYIKNIYKILTFQKFVTRRMQIMFIFDNHLND